MTKEQTFPDVLVFLKELKYSFPKAGKVFTEGSCFKLYKILKTIFPDAKPYYSHNKGHWITKIDGRYYDINGEIEESYTKNNFKRYFEEDVICQSANVPTYEEQATDYNKYVKSI